jgi:IS605 OrfB family transposase
MQLTERHIIKSTDYRFLEVDTLTFKSKNLYNAANYTIRQSYTYGWSYITYNQMDKLMKHHEAYKALPAKVSQQILMVLDKNWKSFFEALKSYNTDASKFKGRPQLPGYKDKVKGRNIVVYTMQAISSKLLKQGILKLSGTNLSVKTNILPDRICQVRVIPKCNSYVIEVIYDEPKPIFSTSPTIAAVDLGLDNLMALTSNHPGFAPVLVNGRPLKSINQFYNKRRARLQSLLKGNQRTSKRIQKLTRCRNQMVDNYLHHASRMVIDTLLTNQVGTLVIGKNDHWKTDINLGTRTNQNFVGIPHARLIQMLQYKGLLTGITVVVQEESYTSKASFLDLDDIPVYGKSDSKATFSGKRIKRGLYKASTGKAINADVNASYNIMRKAIPNAITSDGVGSCVVQPRRVNPLEVIVKG